MLQSVSPICPLIIINRLSSGNDTFYSVIDTSHRVLVLCVHNCAMSGLLNLPNLNETFVNCEFGLDQESDVSVSDGELEIIEKVLASSDEECKDAATNNHNSSVSDSSESLSDSDLTDSSSDNPNLNGPGVKKKRN